ncbi:MAG: hypothetical protein U1E54_04740 [Candidatus Levybacteria bacterium]|nr:hypothetical protein [Candidatus Levybacteria bacterium]
MNNLQPFSLGLEKNLERIAEKEGHTTRLLHWTDEELGWEIIEDIQKARMENSDAYWESVRI